MATIERYMLLLYKAEIKKRNHSTDLRPTIVGGSHEEVELSTNIKVCLPTQFSFVLSNLMQGLQFSTVMD